MHAPCSEENYAGMLLNQLSLVYGSMDSNKQARVAKRLKLSGALPIARDTASYASIMSIFDGKCDTFIELTLSAL